jgi:hypothetical protein
VSRERVTLTASIPQSENLHRELRRSIFLACCKSETLNQRSRKRARLSSVCCRSTGIRTEQNSEPLFRMVAAFESRIGAAPVCAKSTRKVFRVLWGALVMGGDDDGDEPWSEDDLFDLDSALSFGAHIEEIAVFLRREVEDVERKAFEHAVFCKSWADNAKQIEPSQCRFRKTSCGPVRGTKASIGGREKSNPFSRSGTQPPSPRRSESRGTRQGCRQAERIESFSGLHPRSAFARHSAALLSVRFATAATRSREIL